MRGFAAAWIGLGTLALGCGDSSAETMSASSVSETADATSAAETTSSTGPETGVLPPGCAENLLEDPGFEGGVAGGAWEGASDLFDTPICDSTCTDDVGASPFSGNWWVWFGGVAQPDEASVFQRVTIPEGNATLRFGFSINAGAGTGDDDFSVVIDDTTHLQINDAQAGSYAGWRVVELDVSSAADGEEHTLSFVASITGAGVTNFFVDDVELLLCEEEGTSSSTSTGAGMGADASTSTTG